MCFCIRYTRYDRIFDQRLQSAVSPFEFDVKSLIPLILQANSDTLEKYPATTVALASLGWEFSSPVVSDDNATFNFNITSTSDEKVCLSTFLH